MKIETIIKHADSIGIKSRAIDPAFYLFTKPGFIFELYDTDDRGNLIHPAVSGYKKVNREKTNKFEAYLKRYKIKHELRGHDYSSIYIESEATA